ncbi:hypothetical protein FN846DRAFT_323481 [Sphaerosporella brunnea]|uniref:Uncharacterized protein n=1 Tax=Sphaerosporella brunnea TaxID=1250544 RepID=A0A5J5F606_9PEZI|nr:hypothetical protein FN846DRAFT_323481 [Sphaerosporella brunnea]
MSSSTRPTATASNDAFLPRGLSTSNQAYYGVSTNPTTYAATPPTSVSVVPMPESLQPTTKTNGSADKSKAEGVVSAEGIYGPRPDNPGRYSSPSPHDDTHYYSDTLSGKRLGVASSSASINTTTAAAAAIHTTSSFTAAATPTATTTAVHTLGGLPATYKPQPVPQLSPYSTMAYGATATALATTATNSARINSQTTTSQQQQLTASNGHKHKIGGGANPFSAAGATGAAGLAMAHHHHQKQPVLRRRLSQIWTSLQDSEREQIGQFEAWAEVEGMCATCFEPGSTAAEAPRKHWKPEEGKRHRRRRSSSVFGLGRGKQTSSSSTGSSNSNSSSDSSTSDEKKKARRRAKKERRQKLKKTGMMAGAVIAVGKVFGVGSSGRNSTTETKRVTSTEQVAILSGNAAVAGPSTSVFYDPGYGPDGTANPKFYSAGRKSHDGVYQNPKHSRSSTSIIGSIFSSVSTKGKGKGKQHSRNSSTSSSSSPASESSDSGLAYGSSPVSPGSSRGGFFFRTKKKSNSVGSSEGLAYGEIYSTSPEKKSQDSFSQKSEKSFSGSLASSFGNVFRKKSRTSSSYEYAERQKSNQHAAEIAGALLGTAIITKHNSHPGNARIHSSRHSHTGPLTRSRSTGALHGGTMRGLQHKLSNSSGWYGSNSAGSVRSSSSGSSWFEPGAAAHSREIEKKSLEEQRKTSSGWFSWGRSKSKSVEKSQSGKSRSRKTGFLGFGRSRSDTSDGSRSDGWESTGSRKKRSAQKRIGGSLRGTRKGKERPAMYSTPNDNTTAKGAYIMRDNGKTTSSSRYNKKSHISSISSISSRKL